MVQGRRLKGVFNDLVPESRVAIIPNDIDDAPFLEARKRLPVAPDHSGLKRVLFVGFMAPSKGFRDVIAAIPLTPGAHFVFMGEWLKPEDEKEVRSLLRQQGVEERVTFTGSVSGSKKYDLFVSADIFVLPTYYAYEGHAVSSVEALAAGLPIVCTDHGALNESVQDGWNGFFLPPSDPAAIGRRLNQLIQDEALRRTMGERSRQLYLERFTLAQFVDSWSRAIQACCKGNYPWPGE
jgi:glycosyltransferase involved in cell wall biosynthesis